MLDDVEIDRADLERLRDTLPAAVFVCASPERRLWGEGHAVELAGLHGADAIALIERELGRPLDADERATAGRLCATLGGQPLAILHAAAHVGTYGRLTDRAPPVTPRSDQLVELLAALPGVPVPTADIAELTADAAPPRRWKSQGAPRHAVAQPALQPARGVPASAAQGEFWRERLLNHFVARDGGMTTASRRARPLAAPPVLALLAWAEGTQRPGDVLALTRAMDGLFALGARWGAWGVALEHALRAARSSGHRGAEAWALHQLGSRALCLGDLFAARTMLTSALELREQLGDEPGAALTRHNLSLLDGGPPHRGIAGRAGRDHRPSRSSSRSCWPACSAR